MPADLGGMCVQWVGAALCGEEQPLPCHQGLLLDPDGVEIREIAGAQREEQQPQRVKRSKGARRDAPTLCPILGIPRAN